MRTLQLCVGLSMALLIAVLAYACMMVSDRASQKTNFLPGNGEEPGGDPKRGEYVAFMGGCIACHTHFADNGELLAGGVPIKTPFGTYYSPNITSDKIAGIGDWGRKEFMIAMSLGVSPDGDHYYPAFPYTSYSVMTVQDLVDLKAWLDTVEPVATKVPDHDLAWPFTFRPGIIVWKALFFDPLKTIDIVGRGNYLVNGPGHCAECHSPRNVVGGLNNRLLTGNSRGPDRQSVPGITSTDLSEWSVEDLELFLEVGITLSGDFTGGHMADVIEYGTSQLRNEDRTAIAIYLLSEENTP